MSWFNRIVSGALAAVISLSAVGCLALPVGALSDKESGTSAPIKGSSMSSVMAAASSVDTATLDAKRAEQLKKALDNIDGLSKDIFNLDSSDGKVRELLENIHGLYGTEVYTWLAGLYEPDLALSDPYYADYAGYDGEGDTDYIKIGGFYYSNSARDNYGYLPDLESTGQALNLLDDAGLDGTRNTVIGDQLPEAVRKQIYNFALSLKSSDGYYYHPQWRTSISSSRKGRDKGWGNEILNSLGSSARSISALAASNVASAVSDGSVSSVMAASSSYDYTIPTGTPAQAAFSYNSWTELKAYVDYWLFNVKNSYTMGNTINSNISAIQNKGLREPLVNYLVILQNEYFKNGLFETELSYNACNGVMKLCGIFGGSYAKYPYAEEAVSNIISVMSREVDENGRLTDAAKDESQAITFTYNQWVVLYKLVNYLSAESKANVAELLKNNAHRLIGGVYEKLFLFKRDDGGFSYYTDRTAITSQGAPVAVFGSCESDVNATAIAISTLRYVYSVYALYNNYTSSLSAPPIYTSEDMAYFNSLISAAEHKVKTESVEVPKTVTFSPETDNVKVGTITGGVLSYYGNAINKVGSSDMESGEYVYYRANIDDDPTDAANKVLKVQVRSNSEGAYAATASSTVINITNNTANGDTYVFESDFYIESFETSLITQIIFTDTTGANNTSAKFNIRRSSFYLEIAEDEYHIGNDGKQESKSIFGGGSGWFNLRIELTKNYDTSGKLSTMTAAIKLNGETVSTFNTGRITSKTNKDYTLQDFDINSVTLLHGRENESVFYLDDVYASRLCATHNYVNPEIVTAPTCTADGELVYSCKYCGEVNPEKHSVDAIGHDYVSHTVKETTCTEAGRVIYTCSECNDSYEEITPALSHDVVNDAAISATCVNDGLTEGSHCRICGEVFVAQNKIPATGHGYESKIIAPTCTEQGYTVYTCHCGDSYNTEYIDKIDHDYQRDPDKSVESTCTMGGSDYMECVGCGDHYTNYLSANGHKYDREVVNPTCTEGGYIRNSCTVCDYEQIVDGDPATGHKYSNGSCTVCGEADPEATDEPTDEPETSDEPQQSRSFWQIIVDFFKSIVNFFKRLFA